MRTITGTLIEPDGDPITGTLRFVAERNVPDVPQTTQGDIAVTAGAYSGDIEEGVYTVRLIIGDQSVKLGHGVAVVDGPDIDVLTLIGLDDVSPTLAGAILDAMQALADQTEADAVATAADRVATGEDVTAAQTARDKAEEWAEQPEDVEVETGQYSALHWAAKAEAQADIVLTALGDIDAALDTINGEVI